MVLSPGRETSYPTVAHQAADQRLPPIRVNGHGHDAIQRRLQDLAAALPSQLYCFGVYDRSSQRTRDMLHELRSAAGRNAILREKDMQDRDDDESSGGDPEDVSEEEALIIMLQAQHNFDDVAQLIALLQAEDRQSSPNCYALVEDLHLIVQFHVAVSSGTNLNEMDLPVRSTSSCYKRLKRVRELLHDHSERIQAIFLPPSTLKLLQRRKHRMLLPPHGEPQQPLPPLLQCKAQFVCLPMLPAPSPSNTPFKRSSLPLPAPQLQ